MNTEEIYRRALEVWGADLQTVVAIEEMAELQKELCKNRRGKENRAAIAEEIADVKIMLDQMAMLYDCANAVDEFCACKLERLEARINELTK